MGSKKRDYSRGNWAILLSHKVEGHYSWGKKIKLADDEDNLIYSSNAKTKR